jgi:hypothetical protein
LNDIEVSTQGLDKRFTPEAANLARAVLEQAVAEAVRSPNAVPIELLNRFSSVTLFDTTILNLPSGTIRKLGWYWRWRSHKSFGSKSGSRLRFKNRATNWSFFIARENSR